MKTICGILLMILSSLSQADESWPVALPECGAKLERRSVEPHLLIVRTDCPVSLHSLAQLLEVGLGRMFSEGSSVPRSIYLGRVMDYPEWSKTLAEAAAQSPDWDARRGHPRKRSENDNFRVTKLLNGPAYPQDLKAVFSRYGLIACIASVEKVLVFEAREIFPPASETSQAIRPAARLPADAQVWLSLQPMPAECSSQ